MLERSEEQFPELPMQWRDHGYEIDQRLGKGAYGAVYRLVKNRGAENEEFSALKVISWELGTEQIREYDNEPGETFHDCLIKLSMKFLSWNLWQVRRILYSSKAAVLRRCLRRITADCIFRWNI